MLHITQTHSISKFKNCHQGQRCVIVGNGPSLNKMNLSSLRKEWVIGTNFAFLEPNIKTNYICISDTSRMQELINYEDDLKDKIIFYNSHQEDKTTLWSIPHGLDELTIILQRINDSIDFSWDLAQGIFVNIKMASVVFPAIQIAVYMGASEVYLIGVDQDYSGPNLWFHGKEGRPHAEIGGPGDKNIIGHNFKYRYETHFKEAIVYYHKVMADRKINLYNATVGGKLDDIPRIDFSRVFDV